VVPGGERDARSGPSARPPGRRPGGRPASIFSDDDAWDVLEDIPDGSAAALVLLEHHWAVGLRDAVVRAGGFRVSDGFISPLDLIGIGLLSAEEAADLHSVETASAPASA